MHDGTSNREEIPAHLASCDTVTRLPKQTITRRLSGVQQEASTQSFRITKLLQSSELSSQIVEMSTVATATLVMDATIAAAAHAA